MNHMDNPQSSEQRETLAMTVDILRNWEQKADPAHRRNHPLVHCVRAIQLCGAAAIACSLGNPTTAEQQLRGSSHEANCWHEMELVRLEREWEVLAIDEPDEFIDMAWGVSQIAHYLAAWELEMTLTRVDVYLDGNDFSLAQQITLSQGRAMRACCEAMIACLQQNHSLCMPKVKVAIFEVEAWRTLQSEAQSS